MIAAIQNIEVLQNEHLRMGIDQMKSLWQLLGDFPQKKFDLRLARGLSYYTGCVFEVIPADSRLPSDFKIGSIGGGGRYDNLTGMFGLKDVPGVGVSFGLDRIYDTLEALQHEKQTRESKGVLICSMLEQAEYTAFGVAQNLRKQGICTEVYPGSVKLKKQLDYANAKSMKYAVIIGEQELTDGTVALKNLDTGLQDMVPMHELINTLKNA